MIRLHPETAEAIATLINSLDCNEMMYQQADNVDECIYWQASKMKAIIELTEEYGIPHCSYDIAIEKMKNEIYANATLK